MTIVAVPDGQAPRPARTSVIVTGGTRRLGRLISEALAEAGHDIVATYSDEALADDGDLAGFHDDIERRFAVSCRVIPANFAAPDANLMTRILNAAPSPLFGLINNAAIFIWDDLASLDMAQAQHIVNVNMLAPMMLTSAFAARIKLGKTRGIVVTMLDQKIFNPYPDHLTYTVCKGAMQMFTTMCARERNGTITYYGLAPGLTLPAPGQDYQHFQAAQRSTPLGISPDAADIKRAIRYLFTGDAATGFVLCIDGGASLVTRTRDFAFFDEKTSRSADPEM